MASIHISEIQRILASQGNKDALPNSLHKEGYFLEIRFDGPDHNVKGHVDEEYKNRVISLDCIYGTVLILCDENGQLKSIEIS
jgi:hypothetical protein